MISTGQMEKGYSQDAVVAHLHNPWPKQKRPASPLNADTRTSKRSQDSFRTYTGICKNLPASPYRGLASHSCSTASLCELTSIDAGPPPLYLAANNSNNIGLAESHQSLYENSSPPCVSFAATSNQPHLSGSEGRFNSSPHDRPAFHPAGPVSAIPPRHFSVTEIAGSGLAFDSVAPTLPIGRQPTAAHGHAPSCNPSLSALNRLGPLHRLLDMRVPIPVHHQVNIPSHHVATYPEAQHTQDTDSRRPQWTLPLHNLSDNGLVSPQGTIDGVQQGLPLIQAVGRPTGSTNLLNQLDALNSFPDVSYYAPSSQYYPTSIPDPENPYTSYHNPNKSHRNVSMKLHLTGQGHSPWVDRDSQPVRLAGGQPYEQQTPQLGPYVEVVRSLEGRSNTQAGLTVVSDVEETVSAADDDEEVVAKFDILRCSVSSTMSSDSQTLYDSSWGTGSYVHLPSPDSLRQNSAQSSTLYSRNNSVTDSTGADGFVHVPENPTLPPERSRRKPRGQFNNHLREETNKTRRLKACVVCRSQKIRCVMDRDDPMAPCKKCASLKVSTSGKVIHPSICARTVTLTTLVLYRPGGLELTRRWESTKMADVGDWADNTIRTIEIAQGLCRKPIMVRVRRFRPKDGDITYRQWNDNGIQKRLYLETYGLADIEATAVSFSTYLSNTALAGLREAAGTSGKLIRETYRMAADHARNLAKKVENGPSTKRLKVEQQFFLQVVKLVWAIRHMTGSAWIAGPDKLDMIPPDDESYPLRNPTTGVKEVSLPRLIIAQFDSIQNQRILPELHKSVLQQLDKYSAASDEWFTVYLAYFMILHEISVASKDRYRWARANHQVTRYGAGKYRKLGMFVESLQKGSFPLLATWHYFKCDELDQVDWNARDKTRRLKFLNPEQADFIQESLRMVQEEASNIPETPDDGCWEHELFFVSKMFKKDWFIGYNTFNFMDE